VSREPGTIGDNGQSGPGLSNLVLVLYCKKTKSHGSVEVEGEMHVDFFEWDDEDFDRGNTRHILSAGYEPRDIEDAIRAHWGPIDRTDRTGRPLILADIDGEETYIVFEIDGDDDFIIVRPVTAFPRGS
jgi:hypothetical protein